VLTFHSQHAFTLGTVIAFERSPVPSSALACPGLMLAAIGMLGWRRRQKIA
jgi:hypothetical protein